MSKKLKVILSTSFICILCFFSFSFYKIYSTLNQVIYNTSRGEVHKSTPKDYELDYRSIEFHSSVGFLLKGWYIPGQSNDCVVLAPGKGSNRWDVLPYAPFLHKAGFSVFLFDPQSTGLSEGEKYAFGYFESRNLLRAVNYLKTHYPIEEIALLGLSAGGTASILAALEEPRISAVIADSPFANLQKAADNYENWFYNWSFQTIFSFYTFGAEILLGFDVNSKMDLTNKIKDLSQPLFLIHGAKDRIIHPSNSELLYSLAHHPKRLWLVPEAGHIQSYSRKTATYKNKVLSFLKRHLQGNSPDSAGNRGSMAKGRQFCQEAAKGYPTSHNVLSAAAKNVCSRDKGKEKMEEPVQDKAGRKESIQCLFRLPAPAISSQPHFAAALLRCDRPTP